ncbi:MAG: twin-arginine translocase subunit TatB [Desulfobacterales bacterium]|nr:twin-arginine translocase subunit TatB [Desulfobacterales bacterium]
MFGMGMPEIMLILAVALVVIGPKKLPGLAKSIGRAMGEFKNASRDFKRSIDIEGDLQDVKKSFDNLEDISTYDPDQKAYQNTDTPTDTDAESDKAEPDSEPAGTAENVKPAAAPDPDRDPQTSSGAKPNG